MYRPIKRIIFGVLAAVIVITGVTSCAAPDNTESKVITKRRALMRDNDKAIKLIGEFVKSGEGSTADIAGYGTTLAANATRIPSLFVKGTGTDDGVGWSRAKSDVWTRWASFQSRAENLKKAGEELARAATIGDRAAIGVAARDARKQCDGCHKAFRGGR